MRQVRSQQIAKHVLAATARCELGWKIMFGPSFHVDPIDRHALIPPIIELQTIDLITDPEVTHNASKRERDDCVGRKRGI